MSDNVQIALITGIPAILSAIGFFWVQIKGASAKKELKQDIADIHHEINSRLDQWRKESAAAAKEALENAVINATMKEQGIARDTAKVETDRVSENRNIAATTATETARVEAMRVLAATRGALAEAAERARIELARTDNNAHVAGDLIATLQRQVAEMAWVMSGVQSQSGTDADAEKKGQAP